VKVIVDTSIWSLALRRSSKQQPGPTNELRALIEDYRVQMIGPVRQEILSGIRDTRQFKKLEEKLRSFPDHPLSTKDYVQAASFYNLCRSKGVQGSNTDFLICSVAISNGFAIFTADKDFRLFARHLPIQLHEHG